ncbi:hypothetical protein H5410_035005 [Solanum commersonii]|uniref:Uncharacterized protein n=1 Tax=Solanum commersonii TaxID=4109 RepID=A0A9J5Y0R0_SOLCO|nr:hypothetical protein H5410_035005 [Solanum commersonii]
MKLRMMGSKLSMHTLFIFISSLMQLKKNNALFQMTMVYELLKRRFIFANNEKKDEVLINYWLKCHSPCVKIPEFTIKKQSRRQKKGETQTSKEQSTEEQDLVSLVSPSFKNHQLIYLLNEKDTTKKHKESLCLLWFVHNVLLGKDVNNNYPWGCDSYELTVKYLSHSSFEASSTSRRRDLLSKDIEMVERKNVKSPPDLFNPPRCASMACPNRKGIANSISDYSRLVETLFDLVVDNVKRELLGATTIKRARLDDQ